MAYVPPEYPGDIPEFAEVWPPVDDVNWMYTSAWDALVKEVRAIMAELGTDPAGTSADVKTRLGLLALKANVLELDNVTPFTPDADYEPATKKYVDNIVVGGYIDRGDPAAFDKVTGTLTTNGAWHDWDLSAIVPAGAKAAIICGHIWDDAAGSWMKLRQNGDSNAYAVAFASTQVANIIFRFLPIIVPCDANRVIEYAFLNTTWTDIGLVVMGWLK